MWSSPFLSLLFTIVINHGKHVEYTDNKAMNGLQIHWKEFGMIINDNPQVNRESLEVGV